MKLPVTALSSLFVSRCMAREAERDQVFFGVMTGVAAKLFVMDFQVCHCAAKLTPPPIATQDLLAMIVVRNRIQSRPHGLRVT